MTVTHRRDGDVGVIPLDDGERNALLPDTWRALGDAVDQAERDDVAMVLGARAAWTTRRAVARGPAEARHRGAPPAARRTPGSRR